MSAPHFLLTRFNLYRLGMALDETWHEERFSLFERFCLPSVRAQTDQSFRWLIFADSRTPDKFRERLASYENDFTNLAICTIQGADPVAMVSAVRERLPHEATHLLTTTLDNDDALAREFVAQVRAQFAEQAFELINFRHGLRYDTRTEKLFALSLATNPFISLIERIGSQRQFRSIIGCLPHSTIAGRFQQIRDVAADPLWLQVVHDRNAAPTGTWGRKRAPLRLLRELFGLPETAVPDTDENEALFPIQHARAALERRLIDVLSDDQQRRLRARLGRWR